MKRRNIFWGSKKNQADGKSGKLHLVKWRSVCLPKHKGGLGLDSLISKNSAFLLKWWWRWLTERNSLWSNFIQHMYGLSKHLGLDQCWDKPCLSPILKDICQPHRVQQQASFFSRSYEWILGDGSDVFFWEDLWLHDRTLADKFPYFMLY